MKIVKFGGKSLAREGINTVLILLRGKLNKKRKLLLVSAE
jgi:aspartokinase